MKKLFTLILLLGCTYLSSHAQYIGLRGGFSLSSITTNLNSSDSKIKSKLIKGFQGGIFAEFPLSTTLKWLTMETGLMIQTRGSDLTWNQNILRGPLGQSTYHSYSWGRTSSSFTGKTYLQYLDIPLSVKMYSSVGKSSLYFEIGPYVGIGLSGKHYDYYDYINKISWGPSDPDYKQLDFGISMGIGMKIKPFLIGLSYDLGLANIYPTGDIILHNRVFSVFMEFMILHIDKSIKSKKNLKSE